MTHLDALAGVPELWERTRGSPDVTLGVIDGGPIDLAHPCFAGADIEVLDPSWLAAHTVRDLPAEHGTFTTSILFGQPGTTVPGLTPRCRGVLVPALCDTEPIVDPLNYARALDAAVDGGADIVYIGGCLPTRSFDADPLLKQSIQSVSARGVLVVAAAGNDDAITGCAPAILPDVLAVGAYDDDGCMCRFSSWGSHYEEHGVVAPGTNMTAAAPGGATVTRSGTSVAGPIVAGVAGLLLSLLRDEGRAGTARSVADALLATAQPCTLQAALGETARCLGGKINVPAATRLVLGRREPVTPPGFRRSPTNTLTVADAVEVPALPLSAAPAAVTQANGGRPAPVRTPCAAARSHIESSRSRGASGAVLSGPDPVGELAVPKVYALGLLGYDFGTEARRDTFKQLMPTWHVDDTEVPANPYDSRQMCDYLAEHRSEALSLIWTLNLELTPIYAVEGRGAFAASVYDLLIGLLTREVLPELNKDYISWVSIPARLSGRTVKLFSGQVLPVLDVDGVRGIYGWEVNKLLSAAVDATAGSAIDTETIEANLRDFLNRIYYDLRNLGQTSADRALNFAATNAFQAAEVFSAALKDGLALDTIAVEKSPFCRLDSDCWDVRLRFFDPDNDRRARRVFRFTLDVSDLMPVTLGDVRTWTEAG